MTNQMVSFADVRVRDLLQTGIHGFVLKARSPSCGLADVEIRDHNAPNKKGRGLFALALTTHCPALPVEDEAGLQDRGVRDRFIKRVVEYQKRSVS